MTAERQAGLDSCCQVKSKQKGFQYVKGIFDKERRRFFKKKRALEEEKRAFEGERSASRLEAEKRELENQKRARAFFEARGFLTETKDAAKGAELSHW